MKTHFLYACLLLLVTSSCKTYQGFYAFRSNAITSTYDGTTSTIPLALEHEESGKYSRFIMDEEDLRLEISYDETKFCLDIENKSKSTLYINRNDMLFVDSEEYVSELLPGTIKTNELTKELKRTTIPSNTKYKLEVFPKTSLAQVNTKIKSKTVYYENDPDEGILESMIPDGISYTNTGQIRTEWIIKPYFPISDKNEKKLLAMANANTGKTITLIIPFTKDEKIIEYKIPLTVDYFMIENMNIRPSVEYDIK